MQCGEFGEGGFYLIHKCLFFELFVLCMSIACVLKWVLWKLACMAIACVLKWVLWKLAYMAIWRWFCSGSQLSLLVDSSCICVTYIAVGMPCVCSSRVDIGPRPTLGWPNYLDSVGSRSIMFMSCNTTRCLCPLYPIQPFHQLAHPAANPSTSCPTQKPTLPPVVPPSS